MEISRELIRVLKKITAIFKDNDITFCLAGGLAVSIISRPRATEDIDIVLLQDKSDRNNIEKLFRDNFEIIDIHDEIMMIGGIPVWRIVLKNSNIEEGAVVIDLMFAENSILKNTAKNCISIRIDDTDIPVARAEDLILIKMNSKRPQDISDIEAIREEMKDSLDNEYIDKNKAIE
ncbi:nucleotidyl transferase AbiEii/AbiGii toxin family protein [Spirochaetota bacterium]